jgi:hypothetical protein
VLRYWRENADDYNWRKYAYLSIAAAGDDSFAPDLDRIANSLSRDQFELRNLYWIVSAHLKGPRVSRVLERVKAELGSQL